MLWFTERLLLHHHWLHAWSAHHLHLLVVTHHLFLLVHHLLLVLHLHLHLLLLLGHNKSLLCLRVKHSVAFNMTQIAHVALLSERVVVVETSLTSPVSNVVLRLHTILLSHSVVKMNSVFWFWLSNTVLSSLECLLSLVFHLPDMLWLTIMVFFVLYFFASEAFGSTFKVVIVAHAAFPPTVWKFEIFIRLLFVFICAVVIVFRARVWKFWWVLMMKWSYPSRKLGYNSKFCFLIHRWFLRDNLFQWLK